MIKIIIHKRMREEHLKYYKDKVLPKIKDEYSKQTKNKDKVKMKFLKYCKDNWRDLAIGKPYKLREIIKYINSSGLDKCLTEEYNEELHKKVFGYKGFISIQLNYYDFIINKAKEIAKERIYNPAVVSKIVEAINIYFPELYDDIEMQIKPVLESRPDIKRKDLEELLDEKVDFSAITLENYIRYRVWENSWNPYKFVYMTGIRTCPYCNRQYITPIFRYDGQMRAELDHFFAKSKYPYLSMSLYNLVPACGFCNSSLKGTREFDKNDINPYEESLDKYMFFDVELNSKPITINVRPRNGVTDTKIINSINRYNEIFKLNSTYEYHKNIAEEMGENIKRYNKNKIITIKKKLGDIIGNENQIRELIVGVVPEDKKLLNEPLNKLKKDILEKYKYFE